MRIGGIDENTPIKEFNYFKLEFNNELIKEFENMQNKYVLDNKYKMSITKVKNILKEIYNSISVFWYFIIYMKKDLKSFCIAIQLFLLWFFTKIAEKGKLQNRL